MHPARPRLGQLLVDARFLSAEQLEEVLTLQRTDGRKLGVLLVESGLVTETLLTQILSQQLSVPWVSLNHIDFPRELLDLVPLELAEKYCIVPIYVRAVRGQGDTLYVAMEDPMNEEALRDCAAAAGLPARAMIAAPSEIFRALRLHYGSTIGAVAEARAVVGVATVAAISATKAAAGGAPPVRGAAALPIGEAFDDAPTIEADEIDLAHKRKRGRQLTLLDGTTIKLPAATKRSTGRRRSEPSPKDDLTAADLVAALRAAAHGVDSADVLGESLRWEKMMAAVLTLLLRKHLLLEHELLEELRKI